MKPEPLSESSDLKCMKISFLDEMKPGGTEEPQYFPMKVELSEGPSYIVNESYLQHK